MYPLRHMYCLVILVLSLGCTQQQPRPFDWNNTSNWFAFTPGDDFSGRSPISLGNWLEAPAGTHGPLGMVSGDLVFEDGTPIKFWGTNICSQKPYVENAEADRYADFLSYYGQNGVRFHKFTWHGYKDNISTDLATEKYERIDYFHHALKQKGIYVGWSHIYGQRIQPGDSTRLLDYQEIRNLSYPWSHLNGTSSGLVNFAADLQDINIELTVNMLNHTNPHTGLRYADDPALAFVEFQNEDDIFWSAIEKSLEQAPTYRAMLCKLFSKWLGSKYGDDLAMEAAWGKEHVPEEESIAEGTMYPTPSHWYFGYHYQQALDEDRPMPTHVLDKMRFLYETQVKFYRKFERAIRATGYRGVLVGSCWQAGSGISHFYNLHSDYLVGMIDRHNYFGGGSGHRMKPTKVKAQPMLRQPGSGLLSLGMQQVIDRPLAISEWMSLPPNEWTAEAAPIIAIYGLGLQGWDASFSFATDEPGFSSYVQSERHGVYNATSPVHLGLYPALARMVYREDVTESPTLGTRNVHIPSLAEGKLDFREIVVQDFDVKSFTGSVPSEALAIGKCPIAFPDDYEPSSLPDLSAHWDQDTQSLTSVTKQLQWQYDEEGGLITINTPHTKGLIGFADDRPYHLDRWSIQTDNPFAVILITSLDRNLSMEESPNLLITTVARSRNTGMAYTENRDSLISVGESPLLLEPVSLTLQSTALEEATVEALNHAGQRTGQMIALNGDRLILNGTSHQTLYYLVTR